MDFRIENALLSPLQAPNAVAFEFTTISCAELMLKQKGGPCFGPCFDPFFDGPFLLLYKWVGLVSIDKWVGLVLSTNGWDLFLVSPPVKRHLGFPRMGGNPSSHDPFELIEASFEEMVALGKDNQGARLGQRLHELPHLSS